MCLCVGRSHSTGACNLPGAGQGGGSYQRPGEHGAAGIDQVIRDMRRGPPGTAAAPAPTPLFSVSQWITRSCVETRFPGSSLTSIQGSPLVSDLHAPFSPHHCLEPLVTPCPEPCPLFSPPPQLFPSILPYPTPSLFCLPGPGILPLNPAPFFSLSREYFLVNCSSFLKILLKYP